MKLGSVIVAAAIAMVLVSGACGGDSDDGASTSGTTTVGSATTSVVRAAVDAWAAADTPEKTCALMTYGFKQALAKGKDPAQCAAWIASELGAPTATQATIESTSTKGKQTLVNVSFSGGSMATLYLLRECGTLKVNSIGEYHGDPPAPPSC
jgi:hypothetical protein